MPISLKTALYSIFIALHFKSSGHCRYRRIAVLQQLRCHHSPEPVRGTMGIAAKDLRQHVIRPTLGYLGRYSYCAEELLLGVAACQSELGGHLDERHGHGLYRITAQRHLQVWDRFLVNDPELASLVRGLASQHAFLTAPHQELTVNLRYATAIAWLMIESSQINLPEHQDVHALARIWRQVFYPQGRLRDFLSTWQQCISSISKAA